MTQGKWELIRCQVVCGDQQVPTATIALLNKETNQEILMGACAHVCCVACVL